MAGVPAFITDLGWGALFGFLAIVVFLRAQATYWLGRWARHGADAAAASEHPRAARLAARLSGQGTVTARTFLERWGFIGVPASFLTVGFQTMVNASAGYMKMRWDLYTVVMVPGCLAWAAIYATLGITLLEAFLRSPWLGLGLLAAVAALGFGATRLRRSADSGGRTPQ